MFAGVFNGGPEEDRTPDLRIANAALSQLSYRPLKMRNLIRVVGKKSNLLSIFDGPLLGDRLPARLCFEAYFERSVRAISECDRGCRDDKTHRLG
jgi:hypothetical protein